MNSNPNNILHESVSEVNKCVAYEINDSGWYGEFENTYFSFCKTLKWEKIIEFQRNFQQLQFEKLICLFPKLFVQFHWVTLHNELTIDSSDVKMLPCIKLLEYIVENKLGSVYEQTLMLLKLVLLDWMLNEYTEENQNIPSLCYEK